MRKTPLFRAYSLLTRAVLPLAAAVERKKLAKAGVCQRRHGEKRGIASRPRPDGRLIWFHAASVGESVSVLALIERMGNKLPDAHFLITSGTPTSAQVLEGRMPPRCVHQFAPLDAPGPVAGFLAHWRPDAAVFVESELWPHMLVHSHTAGVPLALVNARMSERSLAGWQKRPKTAAMLLGTFRLMLTQTETLSKAFIAMGAAPEIVRKSPNLKALSSPLPVDADCLARMREHIADRHVWVAASTHDGEEEQILQTHARLLEDHPDLKLILAPRHPERGDEIAHMITRHGWPLARRSRGDMPDGPVFLADSLGELGTWYALTGIVFLGGSLRPVGGHNPWEVAQSGAAVLSGQHVTNFPDSFEGLVESGGAILVQDAERLESAVGTWLGDPVKLNTARDGAKAFHAARMGDLDTIASDLAQALELHADG